MPPKTPRTPEKPSGQTDIRRFTSPARQGQQPEEQVTASTPQRRRRIVDSDSEEEQPYSRREQIATGNGNASSAASTAQNQQHNNDAIEVSSGGEASQHEHSPIASDSSDDMYIMGTVQRQQSSRAERKSATRSTVECEAEGQQPSRQVPTPRRRSATRSTVEGEAEESPVATDASTPDESDENAADMYRSSILGLRNRTNAMQQVKYIMTLAPVITVRQVRNNTTNCPTCLLFMRFLRNFQ
jgi:hypothetical protein